MNPANKFSIVYAQEDKMVATWMLGVKDTSNIPR